MGDHPVFPIGGLRNPVNLYTPPGSSNSGSPEIPGTYPGYPQTGVYAHTVDKVIGSAYDTVRYVAENLEYIKHVSAHLEQIYVVYGHLDEIDALAKNIDAIEAIYAHIQEIIIVAGITDEIQILVENLSALTAIYENLDALLDIAANLPKILAPSIYTTDNPPINPFDGDLWWESDTGNTFLYYNDGNSKQWIQQNVAPPDNGLTRGYGSPEGEVPAPVGSLFARLDGGPGTTLYVKETGTGSTGWVAK
jgi:hypothetical protein